MTKKICHCDRSDKKQPKKCDKCDNSPLGCHIVTWEVIQKLSLVILSHVDRFRSLCYIRNRLTCEAVNDRMLKPFGNRGLGKPSASPAISRRLFYFLEVIMEIWVSLIIGGVKYYVGEANSKDAKNFLAWAMPESESYGIHRVNYSGGFIQADFDDMIWSVCYETLDVIPPARPCLMWFEPKPEKEKPNQTERIFKGKPIKGTSR